MSRPICNLQTLRIYYLSSVLLACLAINAAASVPTPDEVLDRYAATQEKLKSCIIAEESIAIEARSTLQGQLPHIKGDGKPTHTKEFISDGQRTKYVDSMWGHVGMRATATLQSEAMTTLRLWDGATYYNYTGNAKAGSHGTLRAISPEKPDDMASYAGALGGYFYGDYANRVDTILRRAQKLRIRPEPVAINGAKCYLLEGEGREGRYRVWFDADHDYHIAKALAGKDAGHEWFNTTLKRDARIRFSLSDVEFRKVDGVWVPETGKVMSSQTWSKASRWQSLIVYRRTRIVLNPDHDALASFEPVEVEDWAESLYHENKKTGSRHICDPKYFYVRDCRFHVDADGRVPTVSSRPAPYPIIKCLPAVDVFLRQSGIQSGSSRRQSQSSGLGFNDQAVLLCFGDFKQRAAHHVLSDLAVKGVELANYGVKGVLVQTNPAGLAEGGAWLAEHGVALPLGSLGKSNTVAGRLKAWGIDRLPWLVLANQKHIIVAEGFSVDQLSAMLERIDKNAAASG